MSNLKTWWIPNPPRKAFYQEVESIDEALKVLNLLTRYDLYLNDVIESNAGGLLEFDEEENEWLEYHNEEGQTINEIKDGF